MRRARLVHAVEPVCFFDKAANLWDFALAVNLSGSFHLTRLTLAHLVRVTPAGPDDERGVIIFCL
jgi:NAD(P)-dependent dehydrogenase (short-subunit alcohol dehydrogenase family)